MIKKYWKQLLLLALCAAVMVGYRVYDDMRTDSVAPEITITGEELQLSVSDRDALLQGITATDDRDGDVTASIIVESIGNMTGDNRVTVTYAAFDSSGNVAKAQRTVRFTDYESPRFSLNQSLSFVYGSGFDVLNVISAWDVIDGDLYNRIKATSLDQQSIATEGIHDIQFRVTNSLGDTATLVLPVEVYYSGRYNAQLTLTDYLIYLKPGDTFDKTDYLSLFVARGESFDLTGRISSELDVQISGSVDLNEPGVYPVSYTVTWTQGMTEYTGYARLMVVVEA